ncbi:MAG: FhaA domain-containing protein [Oryzihumus sp.]
MGLFDRVEQRLERAVNGAFARAFKSEVQPVEIAAAIRRAMDDKGAVLGHGRTFVPNIYTVELSPADHERLTSFSDALSDELVASAQEHTDSQHYTPGGPIQVHFSAHDDLETGVFRLRTSTAKARPRPAPAAPSGAAATEHQPVADPAPAPRINPNDRPWLEVDGDRYPLMGAITVLGRDDSADVVLDDPGISRKHSEIRVTSDGPHLVTSIRDLGSTNGTFVDGDRITSHRLEEGDRITVGRTTITFHAGRR